jgi:hypothetical protein
MTSVILVSITILLLYESTESVIEQYSVMNSIVFKNRWMGFDLAHSSEPKSLVALQPFVY